MTFIYDDSDEDSDGDDPFTAQNWLHVSPNLRQLSRIHCIWFNDIKKLHDV